MASFTTSATTSTSATTASTSTSIASTASTSIASTASTSSISASTTPFVPHVVPFDHPIYCHYESLLPQLSELNYGTTQISYLGQDYYVLKFKWYIEVQTLLSQPRLYYMWRHGRWYLSILYLPDHPPLPAATESASDSGKTLENELAVTDNVAAVKMYQHVWSQLPTLAKGWTRVDDVWIKKTTSSIAGDVTYWLEPATTKSQLRPIMVSGPELTLVYVAKIGQSDRGCRNFHV